jgi:hypothetical protein
VRKRICRSPLVRDGNAGARPLELGKGVWDSSGFRTLDGVIFWLFIITIFKFPSSIGLAWVRPRGCCCPGDFAGEGRRPWCNESIPVLPILYWLNRGWLEIVTALV